MKMCVTVMNRHHERVCASVDVQIKKKNSDAETKYDY